MKIIKFLKKIKNSPILKINIGKYNFVFIKKINHYIAARKIVNFNAFIFYFNKLTFITHTFRPMQSTDIRSDRIQSYNSDDCAIIIQGPIIKKNNFTIETIKIYKKLHPKSKIILSTWDDTSFDIIKSLEKLNISIILNQKPKSFGWGNINLQIISTYNAINFAKELGINYIAKTRSDCRIYSPNFLIYCKTLIENYSSDKDQFCKIISTDLSVKHMPYKLSDLFQFGQIEDMLVFWENVDWEKSIDKIFMGKKIIQNVPLVSEIFLTSKYLKHRKYNLKWTLECWWEALRKYFIIIDSNTIDFFWYKYDFEFEQRGLRAYSSYSPKSISHSDWLISYYTKKNYWRLIEYPDFQERWEIDKKGEFKKTKSIIV